MEEEYRVNYVNDRVTTFGTAFLGLTLECCRCHDHKFDPFSQREFSAVFAFFDDLDERPAEIMVMRELPQPKQAYVLERGDYDKRGAAVAADGVAAAGRARCHGRRRQRLARLRWLRGEAMTYPTRRCLVPMPAASRRYRLTDVHGTIVKGILA